MGKPINLRVHLPKWITSMFPSAIWCIPTGEEVLYLTFDDGPVPEVTPHILAILRKYNLKATFFCVGENVSKYPEIFNQIKEDGHSVGNHTQNHLRGFKTSNQAYTENIEKANHLIKSNMFRPPHGTLNPTQYQTIIQKYKLVMWDVVSCDYDPKLTPEKCFKNVVDFVKDGSIITFHDSIKAKNNVLSALPSTIEYLLGKGYQFRKIEFPKNEPHKILHLPNELSKKKKRLFNLSKGA